MSRYVFIATRNETTRKETLYERGDVHLYGIVILMPEMFGGTVSTLTRFPSRSHFRSSLFARTNFRDSKLCLAPNALRE